MVDLSRTLALANFAWLRFGRYHYGHHGRKSDLLFLVGLVFAVGLIWALTRSRQATH